MHWHLHNLDIAMSVKRPFRSERSVRARGSVLQKKALARIDVPDVKLKQFRASDEILKFLQEL